MQFKFPQIESGHDKPWLTAGWRKVSVAASVGISLGIVAAVVSMHHTTPEPPAPTPYIVPVSAASQNFSVSREHEHADFVEVPVDTPVDSPQVERLRTRNRRLEALVTVLRRRAAEHQ